MKTIKYRGHEIINSSGTDLGSMQGMYYHVERETGTGRQVYTQNFRNPASAKQWIDTICEDMRQSESTVDRANETR